MLQKVENVKAKIESTSVIDISKDVYIFSGSNGECPNISFKRMWVIPKKRVRNVPPGMEAHPERTKPCHGNGKCIVCHWAFQIIYAYNYILIVVIKRTLGPKR